jgi:hypothetical protein
MTITVRDDAERAALNALLAPLNAGSGDASGDFHLLTSGDAALATLNLSATAFQNATTVTGAAQAVSNSISNSATPTAGDIAKGQLRDRANSAVLSFSISESGGGGDMIVADVTIPGDAVAVSCSGITVTLNITN